MFIVALFNIAKKWKQLRCPSTGTMVKQTGIFILWNTTQRLKNKKTTDTCNNLKESPENCAD